MTSCMLKQIPLASRDNLQGSASLLMGRDAMRAYDSAKG
jgi:hypothetical protein